MFYLFFFDTIHFFFFFRLCLQIIPNVEHLLVREWNLISAMTIFNTLGTKLLPVQGNVFIKF